MANLGTVGQNTQAVASPMLLLGAPWWYAVSSRTCIKNHDSKGGVAGAAGFMNGRVPADFVTVIVSQFGQAGGAVSIF